MKQQLENFITDNLAELVEANQYFIATHSASFIDTPGAAIFTLQTMVCMAPFNIACVISALFRPVGAASTFRDLIATESYDFMFLGENSRPDLSR
jgi:hypothetical protein